MEALVEFAYKAEQEDELTLKVGDIIKNVQTAEGGWWEGDLNGKKGMFPENFVKLVKRRDKKEEKREATQRKSVRELANKFKDGVPMGGVAPKKKEKKKMCKVLFEYKKENDDELELAVGDIVEFLKEVEEGWWEGTLNGKHGVFPSNFVEMIEDSAPHAPHVQEETIPSEEARQSGGSDTKDGDFQEIKGRKVTGFGLGNIFSGGPIKLRSTGNSKSDEPVKEPVKDIAKPARPPEPEPPAPDVVKRERQTERAVVRFSYAAEQPDELGLEEGQIIRIIDKELEDEGWWKGELNGKIGVFPDNFVELLPQEEVSKPKKPPPPASSGKQNIQQPKIPEKVPIGDSEDRIKTAPSSVKKPTVGPPPIGKKPGFQKPTEVLAPKPEAVVSTRPGASNKGKENHTDISHDERDGSFDNIESSSQKLTHLTANRAKGPKTRRPPSTVLTINDVDKEGDTTESVKNQTAEKSHPALPSKQPNNHPEPSASHHNVISTHSSSQPPSRPPEPTSLPPSTHTSQTASGLSIQTTKLLEQLQQELNELKANTVSKSAFNELRSEHDKLKTDFENTKNSHAKKLRQLMDEVDDEKKLRLSTEVEIDRVKKLLAESHV